jgi:hypothetical protein
MLVVLLVLCVALLGVLAVAGLRDCISRSPRTKIAICAYDDGNLVPVAALAIRTGIPFVLFGFELFPSVNDFG